ncbi:hypothetical protein RLOatenuis_2300 [Rickettsiales bacterium]|nr:hypothetical protein RLOatenuis_2300 [Rickettsiales bacterium]
MQKIPDLSETAILDKLKTTLSPYKLLKLSMHIRCTNIKLETGQLSYYPETTTFQHPLTFSSETSAYPVFQCRYCGKLCGDPVESFAYKADKKGNKELDYLNYKSDCFKQKSKTSR